MFGRALFATVILAAVPGHAVTIKIQVPDKKPSGQPWDYAPKGWKSDGALPDISFCWFDPKDSAKKETCISREAPERRGCNNTTNCVISFVSLPDKLLYFRVLDLDILEHDLIGQGYCAPASSCNFDGVSFTITKD